MRYQLIGLRPSGDYESPTATGRKVIAILRSPSGRRTTAEINQDDCKDWPTCRKAVVRFINKDGVNRIAEEDIDAPSGGDLPWDHSSMPHSDSGKVQGGGTESASLSFPTDRGAGRYYRQADFSRKTNADYLQEIGLGEVHFDNAEANAGQIALIGQKMADAKADFLEAALDAATAGPRARLLALTPLGRAVLAGGNKRRR